METRIETILNAIIDGETIEFEFDCDCDCEDCDCDCE